MGWRCRPARPRWTALASLAVSMLVRSRSSRQRRRRERGRGVQRPPCLVWPVAVADGARALASLSAAGVRELFVVDYVLRGMNGLELIRAIRADPRSADAGVMMVTMVQDRVHGVAALRSGADDFLFKPLDPAEL